MVLESIRSEPMERASSKPKQQRDSHVEMVSHKSNTKESSNKGMMQSQVPDAKLKKSGDDKKGADAIPDEEVDDAFKKIDITFGIGMRASQRRASNKVKTTKYTVITWAPLSLFMQFKRAANVYFAYITILTSMSFSPKPPASMIGTFALVLFFTMVKEAVDDLLRAKSDSELNQRPTRRVDAKTGQIVECKWEDLKVGDVVKVLKDEEVPADLLLIHAPKDIVFISTMNLDGETNLKDRELALNSVKKNLHEFTGMVVCDAPDPSLDRWEGKMMSEQISRDAPCSIKNLLLRGVTLKNTEYAFGLVLYVGNQTKIMMN